MYKDEYVEEERRFTFRSVLLKILLVVLGLFILMLLFPTKGFVTNYIDKKLGNTKDGNFNSNLIAVATAASGYYNKDRLPKKVGEESRLTLKEMLDQKMIVKFTDSKGVACSSNKSYALVTKEEKEYTMKVNLSCTDKTDYIILRMGHDGTQFPSTSTARCQFVKNLDEAWTYSEWSSWSTEKKEESSTVQVESSVKKVKSGEKNITKKEIETAPSIKLIVNGQTYYGCASKYDNAGTYKNKVTCKRTMTIYTSVPTYKDETLYRWRERTLKEGTSDIKEADCDDDSLIKQGYVKITQS